jgi:hypothetical protein
MEAQVNELLTELRMKAIQCAERIFLQGSVSAKWIATDALRELKNKGVNVLDYPRKIYRLN